MTGYSPLNIVTKIHEWHRFNPAHGMKAAPNTFSADWQAGAGNDYFEGVMGIAGVYIALGVVLFLLFAAVGVAGCFCARKRSVADQQQRSGCCGYLFSARGWFLGAIIVLLVGSAAALAKLASFRGSVDDLVSSVKAFDAVMTNTSISVATGLVPSLNGLESSLESFQSAAQSAAPPVSQAVLDGIQAMINAAAGASSASTAFSSRLNETVGSISSHLNDDNGDDHGMMTVDHLGDKVFALGAAALGLFLVVLTFSTCGLLPTKCACRWFAACNVFIVISLLITFIFGGMFAAVTIVSSDICVAPTDGIVTIANAITTDAVVVDTLSYYTTCGNGSYIAPKGAYAQVLNGSLFLTGAQEGLNAVSAALTGDNRWTTYISDVQGGINNSNSTMQVVISDVSCTPVYGIYSTILTATCSNGINALVTIWALASAACVLIFILVVSAARLCFHHPGNLEDKEDISTGNVYLGVASSTGVLPTHRVITDGSALGYAAPPQHAAARVSAWK